MGGVGGRKQRARGPTAETPQPDSRPEIVEDVALLPAQGIAHRKQALYEAAATGTCGFRQHPVCSGNGKAERRREPP